MRRREFIAGLGGVVAWPLAAWAQQGEKVRRVGVLIYGAEADLTGTQIQRGLRGELQKLGWMDGHNLQLDFRFGDGDARKTSCFCGRVGAASA